MLTQLIIRNLAIIESLDIAFKSGMTVLTGETGAGKSILIEALNLILGERMDLSFIRPNTPQAEIIASFDLNLLSPAILEWLKERDFAHEGDCILKRVLTSEGRSRAYINGQLVILSDMRELGEKLLHLHGQHQHHALLKAEHQRDLLDIYASHQDLCQAVSLQYETLQALRKEQKNLLLHQGNRDKLMLLQYQCQEIEALQLDSHTLQHLEAEHQKLSHAGDWILSLETAENALHSPDEMDATQALHLALTHVSTLKNQGASLNNAEDLLKQALIQVEEAVSEVRQLKETIQVDPEQLNKLDQRLSQIHTLSRKHRILPQSLYDHYQNLVQEVSVLKNLEEGLTKIGGEIDQAEKLYHEKAALLSKSRQKAALQLEKQITEVLHTLEMKKGEFKIEFLDTHTPVSPQGCDNIEFRVSLNPGHPLKSLAKTASGGELSRISLAIQMITAKTKTTPTLIFDEVDVGISGKTAETVGKLLRTLGETTQVFCITHLPQVAALGHNHYLVEKRHEDNHTKTSLNILSKVERIEELARMLGGEKSSEHAKKHAKLMLETV